ncbi:MAG: cation:proton antiporter [Pirellulales bacterium]
MILALGILAQWLAWLMRVPAIVILLLCGFFCRYAAGPPNQVIPEAVMFPLVSLSVGLILFEGGLTLRFRDIRETRNVLLRLVTIGLMMSWAMTALAAHFVLGLSVEMATLVGAMLTVSGPTVIVPLVRNIRLKRRIGSLVKWEGIVNDPIGAVLAALVFSSFFHESGSSSAEGWLRELAVTVLVGAVLGLAAAWLIVQVLRRFWIPDYLQSPVILALVVVLFAISNYLQREAGLVTVTVLGIALVNQRTATLKHVIEFKENISVLIVSTLFIVLAANVDVSVTQLRSLGWSLAAFLALLIFVIRPASVALATMFSELSWRERVLLAWIHPRGIVAAAVASLLALDLAESSFAAEGEQFVFVTFATVVTTVLVYGLTLPALSNWLGISSPNPQGILFAGASPLVRDIAKVVQDEGISVLAVDTNHEQATAARLAGIPTHFASIGSEFVREEIDLSDIGRLLAMTPNDEVNTLAAMEFVDQFGRAEVYQLAAAEPDHQRRDRVAAYRRGRTLFARDATYALLNQRYAAGARVKKTQLSGNFTLKSFLEHHGPSAVVLFLVDATGKLLVKTSDAVSFTKNYPKVIALVDPVAENESPSPEQPPAQ